MEAKNILDVEKFVIECNDMLTGKFLDLNKRLDKFLTVMTKSEDLLDFLADCLAEFDEEKEFSKAFATDKSGNVKVTIPSDDKKKAGLFVTIFNDIINNKINANQFLETYFVDKKMTSMQNFLDKVIRPYRDVICKYFEVSPSVTLDDIRKQLEEERMQQVEEEKQVEVEELPHLQELMNETIKLANQILAMLKFEKKKTDLLDDIEFIANSIIKACEVGDLMIVNGLVVGLNYASRKMKGIKNLVTDLNDMILDYYEFLSGDNESGVDDEEEEEDEEEM